MPVAQMVSDTIARRFFVGLIALAVVLVALVVRPFASAFLLAAVLAGALHGPQRWLGRRLGDRPALSAALITAGLLLLLVGPLAALVTFVVSETVEGVQYVTSAIRQDGVAGLSARLPAVLQRPLHWLLAQVGSGPMSAHELQAQLTSRGMSAAQTVTRLLRATGAVVFQLVMMLIAFYFFLLDGRRLVAWAERVVPLRPAQTRELLAEFRSVSVAVLVSSLATAGVQALVALAGYLIVRVPAALFFTAVTFVMALVPAVGAASVCLLVALLVLAAGRPWAAIFLALWGLTVVGLSDNVIKPLLMKRGLHMHGAIVFFALLGGLAAFGAIGLLLGPLVVAFLFAVVRIWERDYGRAAPGADDAPATRPGG